MCTSVDDVLTNPVPYYTSSSSPVRYIASPNPSQSSIVSSCWNSWRVVGLYMYSVVCLAMSSVPFVRWLCRVVVYSCDSHLFFFLVLVREPSEFPSCVLSLYVSLYVRFVVPFRYVMCVTRLVIPWLSFFPWVLLLVFIGLMRVMYSFFTFPSVSYALIIWIVCYVITLGVGWLYDPSVPMSIGWIAPPCRISGCSVLFRPNPVTVYFPLVQSLCLCLNLVLPLVLSDVCRVLVRIVIRHVHSNVRLIVSVGYVMIVFLLLCSSVSVASLFAYFPQPLFLQYLFGGIPMCMVLGVHWLGLFHLFRSTVVHDISMGLLHPVDGMSGCLWRLLRRSSSHCFLCTHSWSIISLSSLQLI